MFLTSGVKINVLRTIVTLYLIFCNVLLGHGETPPLEQRKLTLPSSLFMTYGDDASLDQDKDGLRDEGENKLAAAWRPYFIFDEAEHDTLGPGSSLRDHEPVVLYQVTPLSKWNVLIKWAFLYQLDGGFAASNMPYCRDWHYGDSQGGWYQLNSQDGQTWEIYTINLWDDITKVRASNPHIQWTSPHSFYFGELPGKPSPKIYASRGKHHQYSSGHACENARGGLINCDDDCGGGVERHAVLVGPNRHFLNVGEPDHHPSSDGLHPFVIDLSSLGFSGEFVWKATTRCSCGDGYEDCFTGGLQDEWDTSSLGCTVATPVYKLFFHPKKVLKWSSAGPLAGMHCTQIVEGREPLEHTWRDNYLCSDIDRGIRWSMAGPLSDMRCTKIYENQEPAEHTWSDNYICVPKTSALHLSWSPTGPIPAKTCVHIIETRDPHGWQDNYLCFNQEAFFTLY